MMELPIGAMIALGMAADTGQVAKASRSMSVQPSPQGTPKSICAPSPMEIEFEKMYKGPYKTPQEKEWDKMLKR